MTETVHIGVIGGSGIYRMPEITDKTTLAVETPYGKPSSDIVLGTLSGKRVAFLARHGEGHVHAPSEIPYRANLYALKTLGVRFIIAANACGSLREDYRPGHLAIPDQLVDYTKSERGGRSFLENGIVGHVSVADPISPELAQHLYQVAQGLPGVTCHHGGTFIIIEGPRFSTRAESLIFRQWGCSLVGMTTVPEAFLAREAEIAYATVAHITDFDSWHESEEDVTVELVMQTVRQNVSNVQKLIMHAVGALDVSAEYAAHRALDGAVMTDRARLNPDTLARIRPIVGRALGR